MTNLTETIKSKVAYFNRYKKALKELRSQVDLKKKDLVQKIIESPNEKDLQKEIEYLFYDANRGVQDVNRLAEEIIYLYKVSEKKYFSEEEKQFLEELKEGLQKQSFVEEGGKLQERVKGTREKYIQSVKSSPHYNMIVNSLKQNK